MVIVSPRNINALIIPTGVGAPIGGFAGDANPVVKLLARASDYLITHPNTVNAALLTDIPQNVLVVEGYLLDRFFAEQVALRPNVRHKIAVVMDRDVSAKQIEITQNCINAATHVYGMDIMPGIYFTKEAVNANLAKLGNDLTLLEACQEAVSEGATALALLVKLPDSPDSPAAQAYEAGLGRDPIGSIEAKISHMVSREFLIPSAHAPILEPEFAHVGVVAPRVAAEHLGLSYLMSVFKCLQHSPKIIPMDDAYKLLRSHFCDPASLNLYQHTDDIVVSQVANLVVPLDCCNSIPMIEAHKHEIELLCVANNETGCGETAEVYGIPHRIVNNYLEAAGFMLANTKDSQRLKPELFLAGR